jgi:hypothetical protein
MVFQRFDVPALLDNMRCQPLYRHIALSAPWRDLIVNLGGISSLTHNTTLPPPRFRLPIIGDLVFVDVAKTCQRLVAANGFALPQHEAIAAFGRAISYISAELA